jgi:glycosyltransferase involved in cell wall biosynthesis
MPLVSVVLPTYNRAWSLHRAVVSVVVQCFNDWELVVVDDGSTDDTLSVLAGIELLLGHRLRVLESPHAGASAARNRGISESQGTYIAFLDSDDLWFPQKLAVQISILSRSHGCGFCFTDYATFDDFGRLNKRPHAIKSTLKGDAYPGLLQISNNVITTPSVLVRRDLLESVGGFEESMSICEDIDLWRRVTRVTQTVPVHAQLVAVHERNAAAFPYLSNIAGRRDLYKRAWSADGCLSASFMQSLYEEMLLVYFEIARRRGDVREAKLLEGRIEAKRIVGNGIKPEDMFDIIEELLADLRQCRPTEGR